MRSWVGIGLSLTFLCAFGCGNHLVPVQGIVTMDGQPLQGGTISFFPQDARGLEAYGPILQDGSFSLYTHVNRNEKGAMPGLYKVTVSKPLTAVVQNGGAKVIKHFELVPEVYTTATTTTLTAEVPPSGTSNLQIQLTSK